MQVLAVVMVSVKKLRHACRRGCYGLPGRLTTAEIPQHSKLTADCSIPIASRVSAAGSGPAACAGWRIISRLGVANACSVDATCAAAWELTALTDDSAFDPAPMVSKPIPKEINEHMIDILICWPGGCS